MDLRERHGDVRQAPPVGGGPGRFFRRLIAEHVDARIGRRACSTSAPATAGSPTSWPPALPADATVVCWDVNYRSEDLAGADRAERRAHGRGARRACSTSCSRSTCSSTSSTTDAFLADAARPGAGRRTASPSSACRPTRGCSPTTTACSSTTGATGRRELPRLVDRHLDVVRTGSLFTTLVPPRALTVGLERLGRHRRPDRRRGLVGAGRS